MKGSIIMLGVWGAFLCKSVLGQEVLSQTKVTNLVVEGYSAVEGTMELGDSIASGTLSSALGNTTGTSGKYSLAEGNQTMAAGAASHAGGAYAQVRPQDTNAFIHATGTSTNDMKETRFPDTAHFDHIVTWSPALDDGNAILSRAENDARYLKKTVGARAAPSATTGTVSATQYLNPNNSVLDPFSLAIGGLYNLADGTSGVAGGWSNTATQAPSPYSTNSVYGYAFVGGGNNNTASGYSAIGGGARNLANWVSAIGGGVNNVASNWSFVGGGTGNVAAPPWSWGAFVGAGLNNKVYVRYASIVGGTANIISNFADYSTIGGGQSNILGGRGWAVIGGGSGNIIKPKSSGPRGGRMSFIGGGSLNETTDMRTSIPGGFSNLVSGLDGTAGGFGAQAVHDRTWVWADAQGKPFVSSTSNEFAIRAGGGVRLEAKLSVSDEARFSNPILVQPTGNLSMGGYTNGVRPAGQGGGP